jgi:two-component system chemotaxis response regulator CheB
LATLRKLRAQGHKMPVIMCSSLTQRGAKVTIDALASGASDYVAKPSGKADREATLRAFSQDLIPKILALTSHPQPVIPGLTRLPLITPFIKAPPASSAPVVLVIGVSTGGPAALDLLLPVLPADFPLPVLIVQHMPELFTKMLAERLDGRCPLRVREAVEGEPVRPGAILIARGDWHLEVLAAARASAPATLHLTKGPLENHCRPSVDVLFRSVAVVYGAGVMGVVLTGMGADGMLGCRAIRGQGGSVLAQDEATSTVWGMPGAVVNAGLAQRVLPLNAIAPEILRLTRRTQTETRELREEVV